MNWMASHDAVEVSISRLLLCEKSGEQHAASDEISYLLLRLICSPNVIATFLYCQGAQLSTNKMQISVLACQKS